ncbi:Flp pilus assembly complex ATPase component TadA [Candidatus Woesearchaeota archaeon]|nr:Flp pilus assembly complex ATPase component TadA [Candidatus Woesearchaeota archaeon]
MLFTKKTKPGDYEIVKQGNEEVMWVNYNNYPYSPSIEDSSMCMSKTIDFLAQSSGVSRIVFSQMGKNYEYDFTQTSVLVEIANIYNHFIKQKKILTLGAMAPTLECQVCLPGRLAQIQHIILNLLRTDPVGAYVELKRLVREETILTRKTTTPLCLRCRDYYINLLRTVLVYLDQTKLMALAMPHTAGYTLGDRSIYRQVLRPIITPDFMYTRLMAEPPMHGEEIDAYSIDKRTDVTIFRVPKDIKYLYHLNPPEFKISEDKYMLLNLARNVLSEHKPKAEEFVDPERMRKTFFNIGRDLITELASHQNIEISYKEIEELAEILVRYTVGFGLIETLLNDPKVQDISINGPIGQNPIFLVHSDYEECVTNIFPSVDDGESWATKFRLLSGRPLDEANPVLDTELILPNSRARIAIISKPLNPYGLGFALRRHRDKPWTLPLFMDNKMISPLGAGLLSFIIDGARTLLIAGTRGSGKTSLLDSCLLEIMRKYRVITVEDSVTGDSEVIVKKNNLWERDTIGNLIDSLIEKNGCWYNLSGHEILGNENDIAILSMNKEGKIMPAKISKFIRHKVNKPVYKIITRTGREIKVTGDHSLLGLNPEAKISEIKVNEIKKGTFIATPRSLPIIGKELKEINLLNYLDKFEIAYVYGGNIKEIIKNYHHEIKQLGKEYKHNRSLISRWFRKGIIPIKILKDLKALGYNINGITDAYIKIRGNSRGIPIKMDITEDLLTLIGLWLADGCYDSKSIIFSSVTEEERKIIYNLANHIDFPVKMHSDKFSLMINSVTFKHVLREVLELKGDAYTKRIPNWVFSLTNDQIKYILKGLFSGDGHVSKSEIMLALSSLNMLKDVQTLLLRFGIISRITHFRKDKTHNSSISSNKFIKLFKEIGFLQGYKNKSLDNLANKTSTHDSTDIIPLSLENRKDMKKMIKDFNYRSYIHGNCNIGRSKFSKMLQQNCIEHPLLENLKILANSDIFWDEVRDIEKIENFNDYVYDISVPECESFLTGNIIAHNTMELSTEKLREMGYNIQPLKVRAALAGAGAELAADEGIRTSLRLGDSSLIVGEIRSLEALALFEAMRVGALANVVAGTIHGDSPYGVFDRIVNDLKVPRTSFKAVDIIVIANPIKSPDGLHRWRRVTQITEVRKNWENDPLAENGFVDLMKYDAKTDSLQPTDALINGESEIVKSIASNIKEWAGNWGAVWENILLRAKIKETIVDYAKKLDMPDLLEAVNVIYFNDLFHKISDEILQKYGFLDSKKIFFGWEEELKKEVKRRTFGKEVS